MKYIVFILSNDAMYCGQFYYLYSYASMFQDMYSKRYNIGHKNCQDLTGTFKMGSLWF